VHQVGKKDYYYTGLSSLELSFLERSKYKSAWQCHFNSIVKRVTRHRFHLPWIYTYLGSP